MASAVEATNDASSGSPRLPLDDLIQRVSEPDRVLLELAISLQKAESFSSLHDVAQFLLSLRYQLCKQFFQDLPADVAKKLVESTVTANETVSAKVYGEIEFSSFFSILQELRPKQGDSIVDIGHGTGKALIAALILCGSNLSRIHGVDIVPEVVEESRRRIQKVDEYIADPSNTYSQFLKSCLGGRSLTDVVTVETGDLLSDELEFDWTGAGMIESLVIVVLWSF